MLSDMTTCAYCNRPATATIIANPSRVCAEHAAEFWTGLLHYTHGRAAPCVKDQMVCSCPRCEEMAASQLRTLALQGAAPSPGDHVDFAIRLAS